MRDLKLSRKMAILVAVLTTATLIVTFVGVTRLRSINTEMERIVSQLMRASETAGQIREELLSLVRAQKNAVLSTDDVETRQFVEEARRLAAQVDEHRSQLANMESARDNSEVRQAMEAFERQYSDYRQVEEELLELALQNTNTKAYALCFGPVQEKVIAIEKALENLGLDLERQMVDKKETATVSDWQNLESKLRHIQSASSAVQTFYRSLLQHNNETDDRQMTRIESEIVRSKERVAEGLHALSTLQDVERRQLEQAQVLWADAIQLGDQVIALSSANTNFRSTEISLGAGRKTVQGAIDSLRQVSEILNNEMEAAAAANLQTGREAVLVIVVVSLIGIFTGLIVAGYIVHSITRPVARMAEVVQGIAARDLRARLDFRGVDEIGKLGVAVDHVAENLATIINDLQSKSRELETSSEDLRLVSQGLLSQSEEASTQASNVAGATEELSTTISSMAAAAEQMSMNVATISSASEEMSVNVGTISSAAQQTSQNVGAVSRAIDEISGSFGEIAREAQEGSKIAGQAAALADAARSTMSELSQAATEINKVTEAIKMIAMQTNLLALNATIEATSAGEAGKGFAVVANEIKELAHQSGKAAEGIAGKIEGVQGSAREAVASMQAVANVISEINSSASRIAVSVDRQTTSAATIGSNVKEANRGVGEIARSIAEVASGANDVARTISEAAKAATAVSKNAAEAANASTAIAANIHGVSTAARETSASAQNLTRTADRLTSIGGELRSTVDQFRIV